MPELVAIVWVVVLKVTVVVTRLSAVLPGREPEDAVVVVPPLAGSEPLVVVVVPSVPGIVFSLEEPQPNGERKRKRRRKRENKRAAVCLGFICNYFEIKESGCQLLNFCDKLIIWRDL